MPYPDNFKGTNMDGADVHPVSILIEQHTKALRNVVEFAFKQWPRATDTMRRSLIDAAATCAQVEVEKELRPSKGDIKKATDERLRYLDANLDGNKEGAIQCLECMMDVHESIVEELAA